MNTARNKMLPHPPFVRLVLQNKVLRLQKRSWRSSELCTQHRFELDMDIFIPGSKRILAVDGHRRLAVEIEGVCRDRLQSKDNCSIVDEWLYFKTVFKDEHF